MQQRVVWFLALLATVEGSALLDKMPRMQTVHADVVCLQYGNHFVMRQGLEPWTGIHWVLVFTHNAATHRICSGRGERCNWFGWLPPAVSITLQCLPAVVRC